MELFDIYTDGAARGNPGQSASGSNIYKNNILIKSILNYNNINTNNYAEYTAVIISLEWSCKNLDPKIRLNIYSDSKLVINQINNIYKVKSMKLIGLHDKVHKLKIYFNDITFSYVNRTNEKIAIVDKDINLFLDKKFLESQNI